MVGTVGEEETVLGVTADVSPPPPMDDDAFELMTMPGQVVGRYVTLSLLGRGGMGVVLAAYDPELDRKVAVKLVRPGTASASSHDRMIREARSMARLSHPNVVSVYDAGRQGDAVYIAMEFVEGKTLGEYLEGVEGWQGVLDVMIPAARGLAAAHERELVHRDFKPDNVMVADDGRVLVMDFGLVRDDREEELTDTNEPHEELSASTRRARSLSSLGDSDLVLTRAGSMMGTPSYMPPEQFLGAHVDGRADQFSFCVTLWEALYGERPFEGTTVWELAEAVTHGDRKPPPSRVAVPRWLARVLDRGLQTNQLDRYPSMGALLADIEKGRARRRNVAIGLAVAGPLALLGIAAGAHALSNAAAERDCLQLAQDEMYWPARSDALEAAISDMGTPYGAATFDSMAKELDRFAEEWVELRAAACYDEKVDHEIAPDVREAQIRCLGEKLGSVRMALDVLEDGNKSLLVFAVDNARQLSNLESCRDTLRLAKIPRPDDSVAEAADAALRRSSEAGVMVMSGQQQKALVVARQAVADMEATGFEWGVATAKAQLGSVLNELGRTEEARELLLEAYFAAGALGDDEVPAMTARVLAGLPPGDEPYGMTWVREWHRHALLHLSRLGLDGSPTEAELHESLVVALSLQDSEETIEEELRLLKKARAIRAEHGGADHPTVIVADINLAMYETDRDPEGALAIVLDGRRRLVGVLGEKHPSMVTLWIMMGEARFHAGDVEGALSDLDKATSLSIEVLGADHPTTGYSREARAQIVAASKD